MVFKLKECRESLGMSQVALAKKSGVSRATIIAIEHGKAEDVLVGTLVALANALGVTVDKFFCEQRPND